MLSQETLRRHAELVDRISAALGVDLEESVMRGAISIDDVSDAVLRCTNCSAPETCSDWIDQQDGTARETPGYCRNKDLFSGLIPKEG